jgi:hypothetical protein
MAGSAGERGRARANQSRSLIITKREEEPNPTPRVRTAREVLSFRQGRILYGDVQPTSKLAKYRSPRNFFRTRRTIRFRIQSLI